MSLLDPTAQDVMALEDAPLRELVRRLCEAEAKALGLSPAGILAGGHQDAKDGGIDVRVEGDPALARGWLPRLPLGAQVKATTMDARAIAREMRPKGVLRDSIAKLGQDGGAYLIACGKQTITSAAREERVAAMRAACAGQGAAAPHLDFYDASRLADWARQHPGVAAWLLEAAGRPSRGWSSLANWSAPAEGLEPAFLADDRARLSVGDQAGVTVTAGLDQLRDVVRKPGQAARLLGQSGMGKTRLVQALFDSRVGTNPLPGEKLVYGDGGEPDMEVSPLAMARRLIETGAEAILIVDNCPAALHAKLARLCQTPGTRLSLLTIDFDIGPDQPEDTVVARLERAGDDLIRRLLEQRARHLNSADIARVTEFSEGNTRVALALASTAETSGSLALLANQELLERLFLKDRREPDPTMRQVARVASLVYAFYVEGEADAAELALLCDLAGVSEATFHDKIGELLDRGLAQQRGRQRAILPQALAIHLAGEALRRIDPARLFSAFSAAPPRLLASFARRLGALHEEPRATQTAELFLTPGQGLAQPSREDKEAIEVIANFAPVAQTRVLEIVEEYVGRHGASETIVYTNQAARQVTALLGQLTYEADLFDRAARLLARLVANQDESRMIEQLRPKFTQLFQVIRSNTEASPTQRFALLDELLASPDDATRLLGLHALRAALNTLPDTYQTLSAFGARRRTAGWWPAPADETQVRGWFAAAFALCLQAIKGKDPVLARTILAKAYPGLVRIAAIADQTVDLMTQVAELGFWGEGWFAACEALNTYRGESQTPAMRACEAALMPRTLTDRFDAFMRQPLWEWHNPNADEADSYRDAERQAQAVGVEAAAGGTEGEALIAAALSQGDITGIGFGAGLAQAADDLDAAWNALLARAGRVDRDRLNASTLVGFFNVARHRAPDLAERWMEEGMADPLVASLLPWLETDSGHVAAAGVRRIVTVLSKGSVSKPVAAVLSRLKPGVDVTPEDLASLVETILDHGQPQTALHLLDAQKRKHDEAVWPDRLVAVGRRLLAEAPFQNERGTSADHQLAALADRVLGGLGGEEAARALLERIALAVAAEDDFWLRGVPLVIDVITREHPLLLLNAFAHPRWDGQRDKFEHVLKGFEDDDEPGGNHLWGLPDDMIMVWMAKDPVDRARRLARLVPYFESGVGTDFQWAPIALRLLGAAGEDEEVTSTLEMRFDTGASSGEWSFRYTRRMAMLRGLYNHPKAAVRAWANGFHQRLEDYLARAAASARSVEPKFE